MVEVWLPVLGFERCYEVSNLGRVRRRGSSQCLVPGKAHGYLHVTLSVDNTKSTQRVHLLVLSSFCGARPFPEAEAAHNDGNKLNCQLTNLRWATSKENAADVGRHGRRPRGEEIYGAVLTEPDVKNIRRAITRGARNPSIARAYGVSVSTIHLIRHNRIWKHVKE